MQYRHPARVLLAMALIAAAASAAEPVPDLRIEATAGGSILYVRNVSTKPLTAWLIELVDYPGSYYSMWQDDVAAPMAPGAEKRIPVASMTLGAVPDYVKMQAALYADGTSGGIPEKIAQFVERRRFTLATTREAIRRLEKSASAPKDAIIAELKKWSDSLPPEGRPNRTSQAAINQMAGRGVIAGAIGQLEAHPVADTLAALRASERVLAASKPAL